MSDLRWKGFKEVKLVEKEEEGKGIFSYYLKSQFYAGGENFCIYITVLK